MWNTDHFAWVESTDPIYKSIPFYLEMSGGRTIGVLFDNTFRTSSISGMSGRTGDV